ncbi:DNA double-strand break repair and VJ recombination XRCC4 [Moelleriella libera RCEF 2490]|uniref:Non-homologous end-joining factor 1 n=1 Tax=Moelleriella libera RCEF 2490 TaxID=1081109 RepID=A0A166U2W6_9HYPO|nr:DNA double-strand break repair and VJ recombination XRCC4 [Moelleriella libera RCEF 2490]
MSVAKSGMWRPLPVPPPSGVPVLLAAVETGPSSYTVRVSDLANVWSESLDRKAICLRGWSENTCIDPSDTPENMAKLLSCLRAALDTCQPDHNTTRITLSPAVPANAGEDGITIEMTCPLPGIGSLKWPIHLAKQQSSALASTLIFPLIQAQSDKSREIQSLIQTVRSKDAILTRLINGLEKSGTGLEHVFTSLSGRKKVTRSDAEDKVERLAPFNERDWREQLANDDTQFTTVDQLARSVFSKDELSPQINVGFDVSPAQDDWWRAFKATTPVPGQKPSSSEPASADGPNAPFSQGGPSDNDDSFQVQSTPPHLRLPASSSVGTVEEATYDDSTVGNNNSRVAKDAPSPALSDDSRQFETRKSPNPRQATDGEERLAARPIRSPSSRGSALHQAEDDSETASEASDSDEQVAALKPEPSTCLPPDSPKGRPNQKSGVIGTIGGSAPKSNSEVTATSLDEEASAAKSARPKRLGRIGGEATASSTESGKIWRGRTSGCAEGLSGTVQVRETSQERADRKREELKQELEKKTAAGPAKKKRRF